MVSRVITMTAIRMKQAMSFFEKNNKIIYVTLLGLICLVLALSYIPADRKSVV